MFANIEFINGKSSLSITNIIPGFKKARQSIGERFFPRDFTHPENLRKAAEYIRKEFEKAGGKTSEQSWEASGQTYYNVIAQFGPESKERIIVGAHYDTAGQMPGADDNASGVAGLIELGHMLKDQELPMRVDLVAYSLEEPPFFRTHHMGSAVHAASLLKMNVKVKVMICLEMIGFFSDSENSQNYPSSILEWFYPNKGNFISVVGGYGKSPYFNTVKKAIRETTSLPVSGLKAPSWLTGIDFSDHLNYWGNDYGAVMITDTAFYRNSNYHQPGDTPDTLDYERMGMVVQGVYEAVKDIAGIEHKKFK